MSDNDVTRSLFDYTPVGFVCNLELLPFPHGGPHAIHHINLDCATFRALRQLPFVVSVRYEPGLMRLVFGLSKNNAPDTNAIQQVIITKVVPAMYAQHNQTARPTASNVG